MARFATDIGDRLPLLLCEGVVAAEAMSLIPNFSIMARFAIDIGDALPRLLCEDVVAEEAVSLIPNFSMDAGSSRCCCFLGVVSMDSRSWRSSNSRSCCFLAAVCSVGGAGNTMPCSAEKMRWRQGILLSLEGAQHTTREGAGRVVGGGRRLRVASGGRTGEGLCRGQILVGPGEPSFIRFHRRIGRLVGPCLLHMLTGRATRVHFEWGVNQLKNNENKTEFKLGSFTTYTLSA